MINKPKYDEYNTVVKVENAAELDSTIVRLRWSKLKYGSETCSDYPMYIGYDGMDNIVYTEHLIGVSSNTKVITFLEFIELTVDIDKDNLITVVNNTKEADDVVKFLGWAGYETNDLRYPYYIGAYRNKENIYTVFTSELVNTSEDDPRILPFSTYYRIFINKPAEPKEPSTTEATSNEPIEEAEQVWRNPKPTKLNTHEIKVDSYVLIDGLPLMQKVTKTTKLFAYIGKKRYKKDNVYPMFKLRDVMDANIGDVIQSNGKWVLNLDKNYSKIGPISVAYSTTQQTVVCSEYSCGTIILDGKKCSLTQLNDEYPDAKIKMKKLPNSYKNIEISKHYNIEEHKVVPKDLVIGKELKTALDHPLNVAAREWALLVGKSGTGKTEAAVKYANDKNMEYVKQQGTAQLTVDDLIGYKSITTGEYTRSLLRDAVEFGKVFILDEMDACNPNTLLVLNGLKQDKFQFPDELIVVHEDFRLVATANTLEYDEQYNARSPMDKATLARFKVIRYELENYELAIRYGLKYIKSIPDLDRLTAREISREVTSMKIKEMEEENESESNTEETTWSYF